MNQLNEHTEFAVGSFSSEIVDMQAAAVTGTQNPADWFVNMMGGTSDSGTRVDGYTALTSGPVWQAVTILGNAVMSLPIEVIQTTSTKPRRTVKRPDMVASKLLRDEPHPEFLPSQFKSLLTGWAALHGNGIARIDRFGGADAVQLTPLLPNSTYLDRDDEGQLWYAHYRDRSGYAAEDKDGPNTVWMLPRDVFHITGPHGGLWGDSLIDYAKNSIGQNIALEQHGSSVFKNSARPSGVLEKDGKMTPESRRNLRDEWNLRHAGSGNAGAIAILVDGLKWKPMSVSNEDAQWLEARRFSREEMASWFNLPAHMLNALESSSVRANLEEQNKAFYFHSLRPWLIRWQDEAYKKLFSELQKRRGVFSVRFNSNALVSADFETRMKGHATGRQWGWLSANDVLRIEDMDDIGEQGDVYMVPANMANAETGELFGKPEPPPTPQPEEMPGLPSSTEDETPNTLNWLRPALVTALTKIVRLEGNKIQQASKRSTKDKAFNFCVYLDEFYAVELPAIIDNELQALSSVVSSVTADILNLRDTAEVYAAESKEFWLDVAQTSTPSTLYLDVTERMGRWPERAYSFADMILEANNGHEKSILV